MKSVTAGHLRKTLEHIPDDKELFLSVNDHSGKYGIVFSLDCIMICGDKLTICIDAIPLGMSLEEWEEDEE